MAEMTVVITAIKTLLQVAAISWLLEKKVSYHTVDHSIGSM